MTASFATSGKPAWSVIAWVDHNFVYIEIPIKDKAPFIAKYPLTAQGLGEALAKMREYHTINSGPATYSIPPRVVENVPSKTQALAYAILRKHGIL